MPAAEQDHPLPRAARAHQASSPGRWIPRVVSGRSPRRSEIGRCRSIHSMAVAGSLRPRLARARPDMIATPAGEDLEVAEFRPRLEQQVAGGLGVDPEEGERVGEHGDRERGRRPIGRSAPLCDRSLRVTYAHDPSSGPAAPMRTRDRAAPPGRLGRWSPRGPARGTSRPARAIRGRPLAPRRHGARFAPARRARRPPRRPRRVAGPRGSGWRAPPASSSVPRLSKNRAAARWRTFRSSSSQGVVGDLADERLDEARTGRAPVSADRRRGSAARAGRARGAAARAPGARRRRPRPGRPGVKLWPRTAASSTSARSVGSRPSRRAAMRAVRVSGTARSSRSPVGR